MNFGEALQALKEGKTITREAWGDDRTKVAPHTEADGLLIGQWSSKDHPPQVYHANWRDLTADDWKVLA